MNLLSKLFGPAVISINVLELNEKLKFGRHPLVLDVRKPEEFQQGHIAGAKLIPLNKLRSRMKELPKGREIVCICDSGSRSISVAKVLAKAGYNVLNVQGGMHAWRRAKMPVQK